MTDSSPRKTIKCVRIASNGEVNKFVKLYETYNLPAHHKIFESGEVSAVSKLVGMPLVLTKFRPSLGLNNRKGAYEHSGEFYPNDIATALMITCNTGNATAPLLEPPDCWVANVGSVLVARADGKDLNPQDIQGLIQFILEITYHTPRSLMEAGQTVTASELLAAFTPDYFLQYRRMPGHADLPADTESIESMDWDV